MTNDDLTHIADTLSGGAAAARQAADTVTEGARATQAAANRIEEGARATRSAADATQAGAKAGEDNVAASRRTLADLDQANVDLRGLVARLAEERDAFTGAVTKGVTDLDAARTAGVAALKQAAADAIKDLKYELSTAVQHLKSERQAIQEAARRLDTDMTAFPGIFAALDQRIANLQALMGR